MKRLAVILVLVLLVAAAYRSFGSAETGTGTLTLPQPAPDVGANAPEFTVKSAGGETFEISDRGIYVLTFWSTLNEGSNEAQPGFEQLAREYGDEGVSFAAVYVNSVPDDTDAPYAILRDETGRLTSLYNVKRVPRLFLIREGKIALVQNDYYEENKEQLEEALKDALAKRDRSSRRAES